MTIKTKFILTLTFLLITQIAMATVDYLAVNHLTKQLYWADTDNSPGLIGWTSIPEGKYEFYEQEYLDRGFTFTNNPYLIEEIISIMVILTIGIFLIRKRTKSS
ncbi:hypothetical protein [Psychroflexus sp. MES1-P1E]|uniref:hypothetical protein n=1 Tax=Psychroflexus sp. MES1-P1E TaxID=2058320 RepID=UPI000C7D6CA7|nr:hypothetical protein [Psychroflexus sp. MES1-P1E]PKG42776.1 hypothetical protein CXF67_08495 [Psychroflexus sp. MES1-P1E]